LQLFCTARLAQKSKLTLRQRLLQNSRPAGKLQTQDQSASQDLKEVISPHSEAALT